MLLFFAMDETIFESESELPWTTDGEFGGIYREVYIKNMKQAVKIRV